MDEDGVGTSGRNPRTEIRDLFKAEAVEFPDIAVDLPASGVGPVMLGYRMKCGPDDPRGDDCHRWRVMTTDGRHYQIQDAGSGDIRLDYPYEGLLTVAPTGDRIAYLRAGGDLMLRDLYSGDSERLLSWKPAAARQTFESVWSSDGRWLLVTPLAWDHDPRTGAEATLIDTETGGIVGFGEPANLYGVTNADSPFPMSLSDTGGADGKGLPLFDHRGERVGSIHDGVLSKGDAEGIQGMVSSDGSVFAGIGIPRGDPGADPGATDLTVVDLETERVVLAEPTPDNAEFAWDAPRFHGWADTDRVLIATDDLPGPIPVGPKSTWPVNLETFDVRTGEFERVMHFPDGPGALSVGTNLF